MDSNVAANRWLVSPTINLTNLSSNNVVLTFKAASADTQHLDGYNLYVSTTGTEVTDFGTDSIISVLEVPSDDWTTYTVDLSSYIGQTIHIGWQHVATDKFLILLDDIKVEVGDNVSTDNFVKSTFSVYPNPASDLINITSSESNIAKITISDINGRVVKSFDFNNVSETSLNISDLANGVYMLNFDNDGVISTKKFIKK